MPSSCTDPGVKRSRSKLGSGLGWMSADVTPEWICVSIHFSFWRYGLHRGHSLSTGGEGFDASGMFIGKSPAGMSGMSVSRVPVWRLG